jgi:hypothetical protein
MPLSYPPHPNPLPPGERECHSSPQQSCGVFWRIFIKDRYPLLLLAGILTSLKPRVQVTGSTALACIPIASWVFSSYNMLDSFAQTEEWLSMKQPLTRAFMGKQQLNIVEECIDEQK